MRPHYIHIRPGQAREEVWLRGTPQDALACLKPYADELTIAHPVSSRVNSPKNNDAGLLEEAA